MAIKFLSTVAVDTNVLYVDAAANKVGIGTTSPSEKLEVAGNILANATNVAINIGSTISLTPTGGHPNTGAGTLIVAGKTNSGYNYQPGVITLINQNPSIAAGADTGVIQFVGKDDATSGYASANIKAFTAAAAGTGNSGGGIITLGTSPGYGGPVERFRINQNGNVGIGTTSPDSKLDVTGGDITVNTAGIGFMTFKYGAVGSETSRGSITTDGIDLKVNATADLLLLPSGNVGIGTTTPGYELDVTGSIKASVQGRFSNGSAAAPSYSFDADSDSGMFRATTNAIGFSTAATERMRIDSSGNIGVSVTPKSWDTFKTISFDVVGSFVGGFNNNISLGSNLYYDGAYKHSNNLAAALYGSGSGVHKWYTNAAGTADAAFTPTERMRITNNGNVGIGTTSPGHKLHVLGGEIRLEKTSNDSYITSKSTSAGAWLVADDPSGYNGLILKRSGVDKWALGEIGGTNDFVLKEGRGGTERLRVKAGTGNVGIGTTSPSYKLSVSGNIGLTDGVSTGLLALVGGNYYIQNTGAYSTVFQTNGAERMRITSAGDTGIGVTTPRAKLDVAGGIKVADDTDTASANKVGTLRYRYVPGSPKNFSYVDMCMQTGASSYAWVNIVQNVWN